MLQSLLDIKNQADCDWVAAETLAVEDADLDVINAKYDEAFEQYAEVYQQLKTIENQGDLQKVTSPFEIIQLYYIYKTLGTAHYDMGEYEEASLLFDKTLRLYEDHIQLFTFEVSPQDLRGIRFNSALAKLQVCQQDNETTTSKEEIVKIAETFADELLVSRENKKEGFAPNRVFEKLLICHELYGGISVTHNHSLSKRKLSWAFFQVLTKAQMLHWIKNASSDDLAIIPDLSAIQEAQIASFTPPKSKVEIKIDAMLENMQSFQDGAEFEKLNLYDYQLKALTLFKEHLMKGKNKGFYTAATGTGKTRIFISQILASGSKSIILVPSISLASQTKLRLEEAFQSLNIKKSIGVFAGKEKTTGQIVIMTYNSLKVQLLKPPKRRELKLENYPLVILDEVHLSLTELGKEIVEELAEDKVVIGCTATDTYNTKRPKGALSSVSELFGEENRFFDYPVAQAIEENNLSPVHICMVTTDTSLRWKRNKNKRDNREITEKEAAELINNEKLNAVVAEIYANALHPNTEQRIFGKQAVAFCAGIEHAKAVAHKFNDLFRDNAYILNRNLRPAAYISGEMSREEQDKILADYSAGKTLMLCGCDLLTTGIDNPNTSIIFNLRPTCSKVMALQRGGRSLRKSKEFPDKIAMVFEFNWVVDGQVFLHEFLQGQYQLGKIPTLSTENIKYQKLRREEVSSHFGNAARWELDWTGAVREHSVGVLRKAVEIKVPQYFEKEQPIADNRIFETNSRALLFDYDNTYQTTLNDENDWDNFDVTSFFNEDFSPGPF